MLNKIKENIEVEYQIEAISGVTVRGINKVFTVEPGKIVPVTAFVKVRQENLTANLVPIFFKAKVITGQNITARYVYWAGINTCVVDSTGRCNTED